MKITHISIFKIFPQLLLLSPTDSTTTQGVLQVGGAWRTPLGSPGASAGCLSRQQRGTLTARRSLGVPPLPQKLSAEEPCIPKISRASSDWDLRAVLHILTPEQSDSLARNITNIRSWNQEPPACAALGPQAHRRRVMLDAPAEAGSRQAPGRHGRGRQAAVHRRRTRSCRAQGVLLPDQKGQLRAPAQQRE